MVLLGKFCTIFGVHGTLRGSLFKNVIRFFRPIQYLRRRDQKSHPPPPPTEYYVNYTQLFMALNKGILFLIHNNRRNTCALLLTMYAVHGAIC